MLIGDIEFPEALIDSQRDGKLVIFAGAGVSRDAPSNLPDFKGLAESVASRPLDKREAESIDRLLGQMENSGVAVHPSVYHTLNRLTLAAKPNQLHKTIVRLYRACSDMKIVTTNFDTLLSAAAEEVFGERPTLFSAPALPLGRDFTGIVHLHGSLPGRPCDLVVTDRDFGRAYITDGWARDFLVDLFTTDRFTVLFIGYSHDDLVVSYLARSLQPGQGRRYALVSEGNEEKWSRIGVDLIAYRLTRGRYRHAALRKALAMWAQYATMRVVDTHSWIREVAAQPPSTISQTDLSRLSDCLRNPGHVAPFLSIAGDVGWLDWVDQNVPSFRRLFEHTITADPVVAMFAQWFAQANRREHSRDALRIVHRRGGVVGPVLFDDVAIALAGNERVPPEDLVCWVSVLLASPVSYRGTDLLSQILERCRFPEDRVAALLLFSRLTEPSLRPHEAAGYDRTSPERVPFDIVTDGGDSLIADAWSSVIQPNLPTLALDVSMIAAGHLSTLARLHRGLGGSAEHSDPSSRQRAAIEPHPQDSHSRVTILVDAARDALEVILTNQPETAQGLINLWSASDSPLLNRVAIHGVTLSQTLSDDAKLEWLACRGWVLALGFKHEVFRLIATCYPRASEQTRQRLLVCVDAHTSVATQTKQEDTLRDYEVFNLLTWMRDADPACELLKARLNNVMSRHPEFKPREYPDLEWWGEEVRWGPGPSPIDTQDILGTDAADACDFLVAYHEEAFDDPLRAALMETVSQCAKMSPDWGVHIFKALDSRSLLPDAPDLGQSVVAGLRSAELTDRQRGVVLEALLAIGIPPELCEGVAELLDSVLKEDKVPAHSRLAETIADRLWEGCPDDRVSNGQNQPDWVVIAINHVGGKMAKVWLRTLLAQLASDKDTSALPERYCQRFTSVIGDQSPKGVTGRVILTSELHLLFRIDPAWTCQNLLPLLNWASGADVSIQAWEGFLSYPQQLFPKFVEALIPLYCSTFDKLESQFPQHIQERFAGHMAVLALNASSNPLSTPWFRQYMNAVPDTQHRFFSRHLLGKMSKESPTTQQLLWHTWVESYFRDRTNGMPRPMGAEEKQEFVEALPDIIPVYDEAVRIAFCLPNLALQHTSLFHRLAIRGLGNTHPVSTLDLLCHVLLEAQLPFWDCRDAVSLLNTIASSLGTTRQVNRLQDRLAELNCL